MKDDIFDRLDWMAGLPGNAYSQIEPEPMQNLQYTSTTQDDHWNSDQSPNKALSESSLVLDDFDTRLLQQSNYRHSYGQNGLDTAQFALAAPFKQNVLSQHGSLDHVDSRTDHRYNHDKGSSLSRGQAAAQSSSFEFPDYLARPLLPQIRNAAQQNPLRTPQTEPSIQASPFASAGFDQPWNGSEIAVEDADRRETQLRPAPHHSKADTSTPIVQGIPLVPTRILPDKLRSIFPFPLFNAVQSKCFDTIYNTDNNFVLSAPTGSGKTAVMEIAICRLINKLPLESFKIVYQAPTKSLCSERQRDWQAKFGTMDIRCVELTGDTEHSQLRNVQHANIIVTTPEKWDSITRKWKDHQKLMEMVKLFMIDEVHMLREDRGATLEAIVSRMKSVGTEVRFIALSATVPNSEDIATWLGRSHTCPQAPAVRHCFGNEFRPVKLQQHVCGYNSGPNEYGFEKFLTKVLPNVIATYSKRKPMMVFCFTRAACVETAKHLAEWWLKAKPQDRYWSSPPRLVQVGDHSLKDTTQAGVAFHHAGLSNDDRLAVEKGYLEGALSVICCTSTLAVGVNLPCHTVIIKNTITYQMVGGHREYSSLEIMQMLGRAGRPQFDDSATAVIMTRNDKVAQYERMVSGQDIIESCLHQHLIEHLNAEIGLGTITGLDSAKRWLQSTFLYVRLQKNPDHYALKASAANQSLDDLAHDICKEALTSLEESNLITGIQSVHSTEYGDAMARYYVQFETMKHILMLGDASKISEILSVMAQASEFRDIRFRSGEKSIYKQLNSNNSIKFPIPGNLDAAAHKVSLIVQSVLGAVEFASEDPKHRSEYQTNKNTIFQHCQRLIRCIIDCKLECKDSISARNALMLARSFGAQVWDDSPLHMRQLDKLGLASVRKLVAAGIKSVEDLSNAESFQIERALARNPPFGTEMVNQAKDFPRLRLSLNLVGKAITKPGEGVQVKVRAELGFLNEKIPVTFRKRPVYLCVLIDTSDGRLAHFARIGAKKMRDGEEIFADVMLTSQGQMVRGVIMCDEIAGTQRAVMLTPNVPHSSFITIKANTSKKISASARSQPCVGAPARSTQVQAAVDEFDDTSLNDNDLVNAATASFMDIDELVSPGEPNANQLQSFRGKSKAAAPNAQASSATWQPKQLSNGRWACNHLCNDKSKCKHRCCQGGLDRPPKGPKASEIKKAVSVVGSTQTHLDRVVVSKSHRPKPNMDCDMEFDDVDFLDSIEEAQKHTTLARRSSDKQSDLRPASRQIQAPSRIDKHHTARVLTSDSDLDELQADSLPPKSFNARPAPSDNLHTTIAAPADNIEADEGTFSDDLFLGETYSPSTGAPALPPITRYDHASLTASTNRHPEPTRSGLKRLTSTSDEPPTGPHAKRARTDSVAAQGKDRTDMPVTEAQCDSSRTMDRPIENHGTDALQPQRESERQRALSDREWFAQRFGLQLFEIVDD